MIAYRRRPCTGSEAVADVAEDRAKSVSIWIIRNGLETLDVTEKDVKQLDTTRVNGDQRCPKSKST